MNSLAATGHGAEFVAFVTLMCSSTVSTVVNSITSLSYFFVSSYPRATYFLQIASADNFEFVTVLIEW